MMPTSNITFQSFYQIPAMPTSHTRRPLIFHVRPLIFSVRLNKWFKYLSFRVLEKILLELRPYASVCLSAHHSADLRLGGSCNSLFNK